MSVRKQTGPQREHSNSHMHALRTFFFFILANVSMIRLKSELSRVMARTRMYSANMVACPRKSKNLAPSDLSLYAPASFDAWAFFLCDEDVSLTADI